MLQRRKPLSRLVVVAALSISGFAARGPAMATTPTQTPPTQAPAPTTSAPQPAVSPQQYLTLALDFIDTYAYRTSTSDWATIRRNAEQRGQIATAYTDVHLIVSDVLKAIGDNHASFQRPVQATQIQAGVYDGFGFVATWPSRVVAQVTPRSPAANGGLRVGDRIERIDGKAPANNGRLIVVARGSDGQLPQQLALTITRNSRKGTARIVLKRGAVSTVNAPAATVVRTPTVPAGVGYLEVPGIVGDSAAQQNYAQQMHLAIRNADAEGRCGWIVDLRQNRGGYMFPMLVGIGPLAGDGMLAGKVDAKGTLEQWVYSPGRITAGDRLVFSTPDPYVPAAALAQRPVAVLVSNLTASAGEATALSFVGRPNTRVFGQNTVGLTHFTVLRSMPDGAFVIVTNAIDVDRTGRRYDGPISVEEQTPVDWLKYQAADDPGLLAATAWLSQHPSCAASTAPQPVATTTPAA